DDDGDGEHHDGSHSRIIVPSGSQSGIKLNLDGAFEVKHCKINKLKLRIDLCRSFVDLGRPYDDDNGDEDREDHARHNRGEHNRRSGAVSGDHDGDCHEDYHFKPVIHAEVESSEDKECVGNQVVGGGSVSPAPIPAPSASAAPPVSGDSGSSGGSTTVVVAPAPSPIPD
ncbi:MAG: hypothetical protein AABZ55_15340, partial [Bdellovibrionota bacterium]